MGKVSAKTKWLMLSRKVYALNAETLLGIRRTGNTEYLVCDSNTEYLVCDNNTFFKVKSFVEFVKYLVSLEEVKEQKLFLLSNNILLSAFLDGNVKGEALTIIKLSSNFLTTPRPCG